MKMIQATLLAILLSSTAFAADELASYKYSAGFSPRPGSETLVIDTDGAVMFHASYYNRAKGKQEVTDLQVAQLNQDLVESMQKSLREIHAKDLRDEQEGQARCTDAPSKWFFVMKGGKQIRIAGSSGCHNFVMDTAAAQKIKALLQGLVALTKF